MDHKNDCCCGHDHDHDHEEMEMDTVILEDENGKEEEWGVLGVFGIEEQESIALFQPDTDDVAVYRYKELENGEFDIDGIESDEEFNRVEEVFYALFTDEDEDEEEEE